MDPVHAHWIHTNYHRVPVFWRHSSFGCVCGGHLVKGREVIQLDMTVIVLIICFLLSFITSWLMHTCLLGSKFYCFQWHFLPNQQYILQPARFVWLIWEWITRSRYISEHGEKSKHGGWEITWYSEPGSIFWSSLVSCQCKEVKFQCNLWIVGSDAMKSNWLSKSGL